MTGERIFPYRWTHRTRAGCIHQSRVGWSSFPILAVCITTMNGWPRNRIDGRSVTWRATSYREGQAFRAVDESVAVVGVIPQLSIDAGHLIGQLLFSIFLTDWPEPEINAYATMLLVDNAATVTIYSDAGSASARHDIPPRLKTELVRTVMYERKSMEA